MVCKLPVQSYDHLVEDLYELINLVGSILF